MDCESTPYNLLARYFADECMASEKERVIQWRHESMDNDSVFDWYKQFWDEPPVEDSFYLIPDKKQIWEKITTYEKQKGGKN